MCPLDKPVLIDRHLIPLFKKHANLESIDLYPMPGEQVEGVHLGLEGKRVSILYKRCEAHHGKAVDPACPACQSARYRIAKELVHSFDRAHEKTPPTEAAEKLLFLVARRAWIGSQAIADGVGEFWGAELLARFRHRVFLQGGPGRNPSLRLITAQATGDFSDLARQYVIPQDRLAHAFSAEYMAAMQNIRAAHNLSIDPPTFG